MGQYYYAINLDTGEYLRPHSFGEGAKLMEHSYVTNDFMNAVTTLLNEEWAGHRLVWAGDYGDEGLFVEGNLTYTDQGVIYQHNIYSYASDHFSEVKQVNVSTLPLRYFLNHDTKEYFDINHLQKDSDGFTIHPLSILTSNGNGRGGGDFRPKSTAHLREREQELYSQSYNSLNPLVSDKEQAENDKKKLELEAKLEDLQAQMETAEPLIGSWAGHRISCVAVLPEGFTEIIPNFEEA